VNQSSIIQVDQSTNRIEHQLHDDLSMDESQMLDQNQLVSVRSKSGPPELRHLAGESVADNQYTDRLMS